MTPDDAQSTWKGWRLLKGIVISLATLCVLALGGFFLLLAYYSPPELPLAKVLVSASDNTYLEVYPQWNLSSWGQDKYLVYYVRLDGEGNPAEKTFVYTYPNALQSQLLTFERADETIIELIASPRQGEKNAKRILVSFRITGSYPKIQSIF